MSMDIKHHRPTSVGRGAAYGAGAGVVASLAMGVYAMVASLIKDTGFFTPLHHIAAVFAEPDDMMNSMMSADMGEGAWELSAGTAILGLVIHMVVGAGYGAVFGAVFSYVRTGGLVVLAAAGAVWGFLVFLISSFIGLPLAAAVFGVDDLTDGKNPIGDMPELAGWGTFIPEHVLFGLVVGLLVFAAGRRSA